MKVWTLVIVFISLAGCSKFKSDSEDSDRRQFLHTSSVFTGSVTTNADFLDKPASQNNTADEIVDGSAPTPLPQADSAEILDRYAQATDDDNIQDRIAAALTDEDEARDGDKDNSDDEIGDKVKDLAKRDIHETTTCHKLDTEHGGEVIACRPDIGNDAALRARREEEQRRMNKPDSSKSGMGDPLIVHVNPGRDFSRYVELTAIEDGVAFDLLGRNAPTAPHTPLAIGWLTDPNYMFVVLPKAGAVKGIDEMFGDNTFGPDSKFAKNGFHALAKWDGRDASGKLLVRKADKFIDASDGVFNRLRFWGDENLDGKATANELHTLQELGVQSIDLRYEWFYEKDAHGNETMFKSVVRYADGSYDLAFDLWVKYRSF